MPRYRCSPCSSVSAGLLAVLLTLASACTTFDRVPPHAGLSRPELEVRFASPTRLVARDQAGREVVRRDVTRLFGRPLQVRNDTLVLEVRRWHGIGLLSWRYESPPVVAAVPAYHPRIDIGTRRFSAGRSAAVILGPPLTAFVLLFIMCSLEPCMT